MKELHYRLSSPVRGHFPGHHRSSSGQNGFEFRGHAALWDAPDPRRLDMHASLRDPFGAWRVRLYSQRQSVPVVVLADLSASMAFEGTQRRSQVMADAVASLAWSAWRHGDSFGLVGCDAEVRRDWLLPATRARAAGQAMADDLRRWAPQGAGSGSALGLLQAHRHIGRRRALVFLLSDFHWPLPQVAAVLASLAAHEVVPMVLWDAQESDLGPGQGLAPLADPENGRRHLLFWRPGLRQRWQRAAQARREALRQCCAGQRVRPLFIDGAFDADAVTRHFLQA